MIKIDTGSNTIFRFDNMIDAETCDLIYEFAVNRLGTTKTIEANKMPWAEKDNIYWLQSNDLDLNLKAKILDFGVRAQSLLTDSYGVDIYSHFTDIVLWRAGRKMPRHRDDHDSEENELWVRRFSSVLYINDDYQGGETFIKTERGDDYISKPKKGTMICFYSDPRNEHGVKEITSGIRVTLPIWFCTDENFSEYNRHQQQFDEIKKHAGLV